MFELFLAIIDVLSESKTILSSFEKLEGLRKTKPYLNKFQRKSLKGLKRESLYKKFNKTRLKYQNNPWIKGIRNTQKFLNNPLGVIANYGKSKIFEKLGINELQKFYRDKLDTHPILKNRNLLQNTLNLRSIKKFLIKALGEHNSFIAKLEKYKSGYSLLLYPDQVFSYRFWKNVFLSDTLTEQDRQQLLEDIQRHRDSKKYKPKTYLGRDYVNLSSSWLNKAMWIPQNKNDVEGELIVLISKVTKKGTKNYGPYTYLRVKQTTWLNIQAAKGKNGSGAGSVFWKEYLTNYINSAIQTLARSKFLKQYIVDKSKITIAQAYAGYTDKRKTNFLKAKEFGSIKQKPAKKYITNLPFAQNYARARLQAITYKSYSKSKTYKRS